MAGGYLVHDVRFAISCAIGVAADVGTFRLVVHRGRLFADAPTGSHAALSLALVGRLVVKALLLVAAFAWTGLLDPRGMVPGVLAVDATLLTVGPVIAVVRVFGRGARKGGEGKGDGRLLCAC